MIIEPIAKNGAQVLRDYFKQQGIRHVFLVPGAQIDPLFKTLSQDLDIDLVIASHESGAGYMADGYARMREKPAVCISIGGPGANNLINAAVTAREDESPVLFITGAVPSDLQNQGAFQDSAQQDSDLFAIATGFSRMVDKRVLLVPAWQQAWTRLQQDPPAPAHLSISFDMFKAKTADDDNNEITQTTLKHPPSLPIDIQQSLKQSRFPVLLLGSRANHQKNAHLLETLLEHYPIPVATTFAAKGLLPEDHPYSLGTFGYAGSPRAAKALLGTQCDCLVLLGYGFKERDTLCWAEELCADPRRVIRIDPAPWASEKACRVDFSLSLSCEQGLEALLAWAKCNPPKKETLSWAQQWQSVPAFFPHIDSDAQAPAHLIRQMSQSLPKETCLFVDAGLHRLFAGHYWQAKLPKSFYAAYTSSTMGWAIAAAIGAKLARPDKTMVVLTGDGCMQMHGLEISTAVRKQLGIIFILMNNSAYGSVYRRLKTTDLVAAAHVRIMHTDWYAFALALGCKAYAVRHADELPRALEQALQHSQHNQPCLLDVTTLLDVQIPDSRHACLSYYQKSYD